MMNGQVGRFCVSRMMTGEDLTESIKKRAEEAGIKAGVFILIGTLENVTLGYYNGAEYQTVKMNGPLEIASCMGNIAIDEQGKTLIHAHIVVSNEKCEAFGGHLMPDSKVGATAEIVVIEATGIEMRKVFDSKTRLSLLKLS